METLSLLIFTGNTIIEVQDKYNSKALLRKFKSCIELYKLLDIYVHIVANSINAMQGADGGEWMVDKSMQQISEGIHS